MLGTLVQPKFFFAFVFNYYDHFFFLYLIDLFFSLQIRKVLFVVFVVGRRYQVVPFGSKKSWSSSFSEHEGIYIILYHFQYHHFPAHNFF